MKPAKNPRPAPPRPLADLPQGDTGNSQPTEVAGLPIDLAGALLDYLSKQPYREVQHLIAGIQQSPKVTINP